MDRRVIDTLGILLLGGALSLPMLTFFALKIRTRRYLQLGGLPAEGSAVKYGGGEGGAATRVEFTGPEGMTWGFWTEGYFEAEVDIVYDPDKPKRAEAVRNLYSTWRQWLGVVFFGAVFIGSVALAISQLLR